MRFMSFKNSAKSVGSIRTGEFRALPSLIALSFLLRIQRLIVSVSTLM